MKKAKKPKKIKKSDNKIKNTRLRSLINPLSCIGFSIVVFILFLLLFAFSMVKSNVSFKILPVFLTVSMLASSFISGFYAAKRLNLRGMFAGFLASLPIVIATIVCSLIVNNGSTRLLLYLVCLAAMVAGAIGGIFSANTRPAKRRIG
ncbi:MAG: TIGR04086 family membrane protein [Clostridiales bacterium]|nr:TIGR04086 family membrane protein [Clostridiales bacterium]HOA34229.1 TIGR04086 family membrane protein [Clostridiales bacterium]HOL79396.1 TIGR04086 family membrane protein [Clostridiales bacterium]HPP68762.1 TIGR04086 family membrane protein [Clostridiales bacterium]HPU66998.1 TIGR04086 family membrane protein [Clostridiales bacterium]